MYKNSPFVVSSLRWWILFITIYCASFQLIFDLRRIINEKLDENGGQNVITIRLDSLWLLVKMGIELYACTQSETYLEWI